MSNASIIYYYYYKQHIERAYLCPLISMLDKEEIIISNMYDISYNRAPQVELKNMPACTITKILY